MKYTIAGIGVDLPDALPEGHFAAALAPFAATRSDTDASESADTASESFAVGNGLKVQITSPSGRAFSPSSAAAAESIPETTAPDQSDGVFRQTPAIPQTARTSETTYTATCGGAEIFGTQTSRIPDTEALTGSPVQHTGTTEATTDCSGTECTAAITTGFSGTSAATAEAAGTSRTDGIAGADGTLRTAAECSGTAGNEAAIGYIGTPAIPVGTTADTAEPLASIILRQAPCPPAGADYRQLDRFDFSDADADCRFGADGAGYLLEMTPRSGAAPARFRKQAGNPLVTTDYTPSHHPALLRFGLWMAFNLAAVPHRMAAFHSSVIACRGYGVPVLGESGTGKSTHTRLWREHIPGAMLLNDDSPIVRIRDGAAEVCGSPWSGKTPCYRNLSLPIAAFVRLSQAPHNRIRRLRPLEALGALLPSVPPAFARDETLQDALCDLVSQLVQRVPVYHLECLPDADAAQLAYATIFDSAGK